MDDRVIWEGKREKQKEQKKQKKKQTTNLQRSMSLTAASLAQKVLSSCSLCVGCNRAPQDIGYRYFTNECLPNETI